MCRNVLIMLGILFLLSTARANADDFAYAYCPLGEGYVFLYDSVDGFQVLANLKCGQRLTVLDARDRNRLRVRTADGKEGYVPKSSATMVAPAGQRQPAAPPNANSPQPQVPEPPQVQPKTEAPAEPRVKVQTPLEPQPQPQPQAQPQPAPKPEPQAKPQAQPEPQPQPAPQPETQAQLQPEPQPIPQAPSQTPVELRPEAESQPPAEPQLPAQPQVQPEPQAQPEAQPKPEPEAKPQAQPQPKLPPPPAATAFTPFSTLGYEQNVPRLEAFGGFSYLNAGTSGLASRQSVIGFEGALSINANRWLAGEANFSGYYKTIDIINVATVSFHDYAALAGPRFNVHKAFFHALAGIDHLAGITNFYAVNSSPANVLAGAGGGGVQWSVTRQFALRTSADYFLSRFGGVTQNNFRVTLGIVFQAGSIRGE